MVMSLPPNAGVTEDTGSILGSGGSPGEGNDKPTLVFLPGESHGQRSLRAIIHGVAKSQTHLTQLSMHA